MEAMMVDENGTETGQIIVTTIGGRNGQPKQNRGKLLQLRRFCRTRVIRTASCFFSTTDKDELYLVLVFEFVPETVHRVAEDYSRANQRMPMLYVKLYPYQVLGTPTREEIKCMNPKYTEFKFPQIKAHPWHKFEALIHPFLDELRDPNARPLPPLFNFKPQGLSSLSKRKLYYN